MLGSRHAALEDELAHASAALVDALDRHADRLAWAQRREVRLARRDAEMDVLLETVGAKRAEIRRLADRARLLATAADPAAADLAVLRAIAEDARAAAEVVAGLASRTAGDAVGRSAVGWRWPLSGVVTQTFGPSTLGLVPPGRLAGVDIAHFHDGIDIAAPLGAAVLAAADGVVTFVGHLPDGAMVVVIAHDDGIVSLSAHLDDTFAAPAVRAGDRVRAGEVIGHVGLTGITTGPHLHFSLRSAAGPIDPLVMLAE